MKDWLSRGDDTSYNSTPSHTLTLTHVLTPSQEHQRHEQERLRLEKIQRKADEDRRRREDEKMAEKQRFEDESRAKKEKEERQKRVWGYLLLVVYLHTNHAAFVWLIKTWHSPQLLEEAVQKRRDREKTLLESLETQTAPSFQLKVDTHILHAIHFMNSCCKIAHKSFDRATCIHVHNVKSGA